MKLEEIYYHVRLPIDYKKFWELNQEMSYIEPFSTFKKKKNSAKIMTAIYMIYDPKSQTGNSGVTLSKVKKDVSKNFLGKEDYPWIEIKDIVTAYNHYSKTKIEKELDSWWIQLKERKEFLNEDLDWEENPTLKESMLLKTDEHFERYKRLADSLKEERQEKLHHGDYTVSLLEAWSLQ